MKIDFSIVDTTQFMMHQHIIDGEVCTLIQPQHIGAKWTSENKIFRSSLWNSGGELISASFCKFVNWGENPENFPVPTSLKNTNIVEKIDGSLLIVSKWKGKYILRTRGTVDAHKLDNGHELALFEQDILPNIKDNDDTWSASYLFEWTSPSQRIILNYGDIPNWYLIGIVRHEDYSLVSQDELNEFASYNFMKRPPCYTFPDVPSLMAQVELWKGKEGVVVYSKNDQVLHKVKALEYLVKHRFKSEATLENTLELYFSMGKLPYQEFERKLIETFDHECFEMVRGFASNICDANKQVQQIISGINTFVEDTLKPLHSRREQAEKVLSAYSTTNRASMVFTRLDGKTLSDDQVKKLFWQLLKK